MEPQQTPQPIVPPGPSPVQLPQQPVAPPPNGDKPPDSSHKPGIVYGGFILAFFVPIVGLIVSIIARRKVLQKSLPGKGLATAGIVVGGVLTLINFLFIGFIIWMFGGLGVLRGNDAEHASKSLTAQIEQAGGKKICSNGDSGYGIDNITPWYDAYYQVPDSPDLTTKIKNIAAGHGYQLITDQDLTKQLQGIPDKNGDISEPYGGEQFNPKSDYLKANNGDKELTITINRQTDVALYCDTGQYGRKQPTGGGAILSISLQLPDIHR